MFILYRKKRRQKAKPMTVHLKVKISHSVKTKRTKTFVPLGRLNQLSKRIKEEAHHQQKTLNIQKNPYHSPSTQFFRPYQFLSQRKARLNRFVTSKEGILWFYLYLTTHFVRCIFINFMNLLFSPCLCPIADTLNWHLEVILMCVLQNVLQILMA